MKKSDYFYMFFFLAIHALIVYGFIIHFWMMVGLMFLSSVFSFVVFLVQTRVNSSATDTGYGDKPIDFYKVDKRTTYYITEQRKQANAD